MRPLLAAALLAIALTAADAQACPPTWPALEVGRALTRQGVGDWRDVPQPKGAEMSAAVSRTDKAIILTFGCQGDYNVEIAREDAESEQRRFVRFQNDSAFVAVLFYRPVTAREGAVVRITLADLTP